MNSAIKASFSIVTVVYNDVSHIRETMDSVIEQSYKEIEYILIDGWSTDGTKEAIRKYLQTHTQITHQESGDGKIYIEATHLHHPNLTFKFLSERDKGIYDAMNKGITLATKEWINFMNCGDQFCNNVVLEKISKQSITQVDLIYGDTIVFFKKQNKYIHYHSSQPDKLYRFFSGFIHQSFFIKTTICKKFPYDTSYRLAADYDLIYRLFVNQYRFKHIPEPIAIFSTDGSSDINAFKSLKEAYQIALKYKQKSFLKITCFYYFSIFKKMIKLYTPNCLLKPILYFFAKFKELK